MPEATMTDVMKYFDMKPAEFREDWKEMSDADKKHLKTGIGDGSLNY